MYLPVYWRLLTKTFLKVFVVCTLCTFLLGLILYNHKFTSFIAAGASLSQVLSLAVCFMFRAFYLIISLTTLFSAFITTYQLSANTEIISLQTSGMSLSKILTPIYYAVAFVSIGNFMIANSLSPHLRSWEAKHLKENKNLNPLVLLRKDAVPQSKNLHIEMELSESGTVAKEVLIAFKSPKQETISLLIADKLKYGTENISGENGSFISHMENKNEGFNHLVIANQKTFTSSNSLIQPFFNPKNNKQKTSIKATSTKSLFTLNTIDAKKELLQRISASLLPLTFGLFGVSLGIFQPKQLGDKRWYLLIGLTLLFFFMFFQAKTISSFLPVIGFFYFAPHVLLLTATIFLQKIYREGRL